jgi:hypothetical protein
VVLGTAVSQGIPGLIAPAVRALARPSITFAEWSADQNIIPYLSREDVGKIGRMKEKLMLTRITLCQPPPVSHDQKFCHAGQRERCQTTWKRFWLMEVVPRLLELSDAPESQLTWIQKEVVSKAKIEGMNEPCMNHTIKMVDEHRGWGAEVQIPEGAIESLMVPDRLMLSPDLE